MGIPVTCDLCFINMVVVAGRPVVCWGGTRSLALGESLGLLLEPPRAAPPGEAAACRGAVRMHAITGGEALFMSVWAWATEIHLPFH
jgi:hypothetical protein